MADIYTSSAIIVSGVYAEMIQEAALDALQATPVIAPLVYNVNCEGIPSKSYSIPIYPTLTASSIGETADLTSTAFTPTDAVISISEYGWMTIQTDIARDNSVFKGLAADIGTAAGQAIGRQVDTTLAALFDNLNGNTAIGTSGTAITINNFLAAIYTLENAKVTSDLVGVFHPLTIHVLRKVITASTATAVGWGQGPRNSLVAPKAQANGFIDNIYGVDVYQTTLCNTANGATADRVGAIMGTGQQSALALGTWRPVRVEFQRDASRRGTEIVVTSQFGAVELRDAAGVPIVTKGSA